MPHATPSPTLLRTADPPRDEFGVVASLAHFRERCLDQAHRMECFARLAARMGDPRSAFRLLRRRSEMRDLADRFGSPV